MVLLFFTWFTNAQSILSGYVKSTKNLEPIPYCSVLIKTTDHVVLSYAITNDAGFYSVELPKTNKDFFVEASIITHVNGVEKIKIDDLKANKELALNFNLDERLTKLDEVFVKAEKQPVIVKKDTVTYNINKFKDGSERAIEDLLKKLPGISVSDNGALKFKGNQVTHLLLDGDDIFNQNYTIGTKNINTDIVEGIQAIEDYNANPLLKGVKKSQDIAVNLVLKKGKTDVSGDIELGAGLKEKAYLKTNAISVSKTLKGFSTLSYNNIAENYSPNNFNTNNFDISKSKEISQRTTNLVNTNNFNSILTDNRVSVNSNYFGSVNGLYKFNKKLSLKANYSMFNDKLIRNERTGSFYYLDTIEYAVNTEESFVKKPSIHTFDYELIYHINKKSLLTNTGKLDFQNIKSTSIGFNNENFFENETASKNLFLKNNLEYTYKINSKKVFQLSSHISTNSLPQNVDVFSGTESFNQDIKLKKNLVNLEAKLLSKLKNVEVSFIAGYNFDENFINSELNNISIDNQFLSNDVYYKLSKLYFNIDYQYKVGKWGFPVSFKNELLNTTFNDFNVTENYGKNRFLVSPNFGIVYYLNKKSSLYSKYSLSNRTPHADKTYSGLIHTNSRSLLNNNFTFKVFKNHSLNLGYRINDFYNLFQFNIYTNYNFQKYGYVNKLNLSETRDYYTSILNVSNNKRLAFGLSVEKYLDPLKSTFNLNSSYNINTYQNIVNTSGLRNIKNKSFLGELNIRTGFSGNINFVNKVEVNMSNYTVLNSDSSTFTTFKNDFSINHIKNNVQFKLNSQYFNPDLNANISGDLFLDSVFICKKNNIEYALKFNNILNNKVYRNISNNEFSTSFFEHNLVERFILLSVGFKF
ncbi:peptidase associated/transthyretin-like domain-containing protein [Algibacter pacificus]|uniref:hypothetical protein n=1 Tax=Algibacter pacificus TaxID=2599389 RepID=UPI00164F8251|nr:hypothetical protein [Algibacter pacificus]